MRGLIVALLYIGGGVAVVVVDPPGLAILAVCTVDVIVKAVRNARIDRQLSALSARYAVMFGQRSEASVTDAGRLAGFAAGGTVGAGIGMAVGLARDLYDNARAENAMVPEQRALHQEIQRVAATKSSYRLTFALFSWLAIVWAARWAIEVAAG
ncbi:MAG: hypothetical protein KIT84_00510 [Labilithrix sp.]|nr:hypothetical protein [Labilithrix sp.]MCW5809465.1 hypothetical protein [Labilithrix sp.]